jgi:hypothetical protein
MLLAEQESGAARFSVKTGKSAGAMLALLTQSSGEYAVKKWSIFNGTALA